MPPKPKELESAARTFRSFALCGTRSMPVQLSDGLSRFSVGGTRLLRIAWMQKIASTLPAAPSRWPMADLVEDMEIDLVASPNSRFTAPSSISSPSGVEVPCAFT